MKSLNPGVLPWQRMTHRTVVDQVQTETPEETYDPMKAVEVQTHGLKQRSIALTNFNKVQGRDDKLLRTNDAFANVLLENTKDERALQIEARKEANKKYLDTSML